MLTVVKSYALEGISGYPVDVEVDTTNKIPGFDIVGLAGNGIKEARNRVRAAVINSGYDFCPKRITVNLAPADSKKEGSYYDLPIAVAFLASTEQIPANEVKDFIIIGELSLDGSLRHVKGITPILISAYQNGYKKFIIPYENASEAVFINGIEVYPVKSLSETCSFFCGLVKVEPVEYLPYEKLKKQSFYEVDMSDIKGQNYAKRAIEIAVAGGHNILMNGAAGAGKTMLAKGIPTIMPQMTFEEAIETTKIHSVAGIVDIKDGIVIKRPFRSPHHTATLYSLTGGGSNSTPGEISLANNGVLFLDELPEYSKKTLESLRQPLEDRVITVARVNRTIEYPANFMLIASMNPCPCGNYGSKDLECKCTPVDRARYEARISGPLLDRIDIQVKIDSVRYDDLCSKSGAETSERIKERVEKTRKIQADRFKGMGIHTNAQMNSAHVNMFCKLDADADRVMRFSYDRYKLSARGMVRVLKVARTIADLKGQPNITSEELFEAVQFRIRKNDQ